MISIDAHELAALAVELPKMGLRAPKVVSGILEEAAHDIEEAWRRNATASAGEHGKLYPATIETERLFGTDIAFEVGPNPSMPQGRMSFEEGSVNQPPHLDGQKALDEVGPNIIRRLDGVLGLLGL